MTACGHGVLIWDMSRTVWRQTDIVYIYTLRPLLVEEPEWQSRRMFFNVISGF